MSHAKCKQDLPKDAFFVLDLSDVEGVHDVTNPNYINRKPRNLKACDVKSRSTPKKITPHIVKSREFVPSKLPPEFQIFLNKNDNLGNHEFCLVVDIEIISLVNNVENSKAEKDNFSFLDQPTELAMDNCATFHACTDKNLFIGDIKESPNIRVKGVSGKHQVLS